MRVSDQRLLERESQSRSWVAPLPDVTSMPRYSAAPRIRVEWDTRDTMNNRLWSDMQVTGPMVVTSAGLSSHPSGGANLMNPTVSRQDNRSYLSSPYFPDAAPIRQGEVTQARPAKPTPGVWSAGDDDRNAVRGIKNSVQEDNRFRSDDAGSRIMERNFTHQWIPTQMTQQIVESQIQTAELLRPQQDDYRVHMKK